MKKLVGILTAAICLMAMSGCDIISGLIGSEKAFKDVVEERLSLDLSAAEVLEEWDTFGWFGDGEAFLKLSVPDGFERELDVVETVDGKVGDGWRALPLTGTAYEYYYEWGGLFEHPETGEKVIPEIENGYWKMAGSAPQNWEIAILDTDADILYYYEYDS